MSNDIVKIEPIKADSIDDSIDDKLNKICEIDYTTISNAKDLELSDLISLRDICDIENNYQEMKNFIKEHDESLLQKDIEDLNIHNYQHFKNQQSGESVKKFKLLLMLRIFKQIKKNELSCLHNKLNFDNNRIIETYNSDTNKISVMVHDFNKNNKSYDECFDLLKNIITAPKMKYDLLKYELINYSPKEKILVESSCLNNVSELIKTEINRFNHLIRYLIEDDTWIINNETTKNFIVPKNKFVISNTTEIDNINNDLLLDHMDLLCIYLKRMFNVPLLKYSIVEDNKYDIAWILILIGFYTDNNTKK